MGSSAKPSGCAGRLFVGLGCGCVYPLGALLLLSLCAWFFLAEPLNGIMKPINLPEFAGPEQEDFWNLQEKRLAAIESGAKFVSLNNAELNAVLAGFNLVPQEGFCLQRIRFQAGEGGGRLFLIGSGFFMRSLVFALKIETSQSDSLVIKELAVNSWQVSSSGSAYPVVLNYLARIFNQDSIPQLRELRADPVGLKIAPDQIIVPAKLIVK